MICGKCGREIPDDAAFCGFCGLRRDAALEEYDRDEYEKTPHGDYGVYDYFELKEEDPAMPDIFGSLLGGEDYPDEDPPRRREEARRPSLPGILLSVLLATLIFAVSVSAVLRYALSDGAVMRAVSGFDFDSVYVGDDGKSRSFSDFLSGVLSEAGEKYGFSQRDAKKLIRDEAFCEYLGGVFVKYKNDAYRGKELKPYDLSALADWMRDNPETLAKVTSLEVNGEVCEGIKRALGKYTIDLGASDFREATGVDRTTAIIATSGATLFVLALLCVGALFLILAAGGFKAGYFFLFFGVSCLLSGLAVSAVFGASLIASSGAGVLRSVIVSSGARPFTVTAAALVAAGLVMAVSSAVASKRR